MIKSTYFGFRVQIFIIYLYKILEGAPHFYAIIFNYTLFLLYSLIYNYFLYLQPESFNTFYIKII